MQLQNRLTTVLEPASVACWDDESIPSALRAFGVRLHSMGSSLRETAAVLEVLGVHRSHQAVWQWVHQFAVSAPDPPSAVPTRVAVDETAVHVGTEWYWLSAAIDLESKLLLGVRLSPRWGSSLAATFISALKQHDLSETTFLVDGFGYLNALARCDLGSQLEYADHNTIEKWFQTMKMRIERFHTTWTGGPASAAR